MKEYLDKSKAIMHLADIALMVAPDDRTKPEDVPIRKAKYDGLATAIGALENMQGVEAVIDLTKDEAFALAEHIDFTLYDRIRDDTDIDSMYWLRNMARAYEKLCEYGGYVGLTEQEKEEKE